MINSRRLYNFLKKCRDKISDSGENFFVRSRVDVFGKEAKETLDYFDEWMESQRREKLWVGVSGSWRIINQKVVNDTALLVRHMLSKGAGILTGGALGVDYIATEIVLKEGNPLDQLRIILPINRDAFMEHFTNSYYRDGINRTQADFLSRQIYHINTHFPATIFDKTPFNETEFLIPDNKHYREISYDFRSGLVGYGCDGLFGLCVNNSRGVRYTEEVVKRMGKYSFVHPYTINPLSKKVIHDYDQLCIPNLQKSYPLESVVCHKNL